MNRTKVALALLSLNVALGAAHATTRYEENDKALTYSGTWNRVADPQASDGYYMVSNNVGDTVTFQIPGDNFILYRRLATDGGTVSVSVDNNYLERVYILFPETREQVPAVIENLGPGPHTITLTVSINFATGTGGNVYIDAIEFPNQYVPSASQQLELTTANQNRSAAGLPPLALSSPLDLAAKSYADYLANNITTPYQITHAESQGPAYFTGNGPTDRGRYFGYENLLGEVANPAADPVASLQGWMATVYHRLAWMQYSSSYIGFGNATTPGNSSGGPYGYAVVDFGITTAAPQSRSTSTWPYNNQTNVPLTFQNETPNPFAMVANPPQGYPISLHLAQPANVTTGADNTAPSATLTANNQPVPVYYLDRNNDTSNDYQSPQITGDDYFMIPQQPLAPGTTYTAAISGTDTKGHQFTQTWSFSTVPLSSISNIFVYTQPDGSYTIQWNTAGAVKTSSVQYGSTTSYGTTMPGSFDGYSYAVDLMGLAAGTYHYQITATDSNGVTSTTPDATFTVGGSGTTTTAVTPNASYVKTDFATQGSWSGVYGNDGYFVVSDNASVPSYVVMTPSGNTGNTWAQSTNDVRALQKPSAKTDRIAASWYTLTSMTIDLNISDGNTHQVALYVLDWDGWAGGRTERVDILDSSGNILDSRPISGFGNGQYMIWNLTGHVVARITNTDPNNGSNATVAGIFFN